MEQVFDVEQAQRGGTRPKEVEQAQRSTIPAFWRTSLRSAPRFAGQLLKKGGTREMWNKSLMWNRLLMWNKPKDVEQAQRSGTGPKINHTFSAEVEQRSEET